MYFLGIDIHDVMDLTANWLRQLSVIVFTVFIPPLLLAELLVDHLLSCFSTFARRLIIVHLDFKKSTLSFFLAFKKTLSALANCLSADVQLAEDRYFACKIALAWKLAQRCVDLTLRLLRIFPALSTVYHLSENVLIIRAHIFLLFLLKGNFIAGESETIFENSVKIS